MIRVFNGKSRGLGNSNDILGMILDFKFREHIHEFPGGMLHVFMVLALHSNEDGLSFPSYSLLQKETGLTRTSISNALDKLCKLEIDNHRILIRFSENGKLSNRYLIFPTSEEVERIEASLKNGLVQKIDQGSLKNGLVTSLKNGLEVNPLEVNPLTETIDSHTSYVTAPELPEPAEDPLSVFTEDQEQDSQKSKSREGKKDSKPAVRFQIAAALAHVTGMDFEKNRGRLFREAKNFTDADLARIQREYGPGGLWYTCDWRGLSGEKPTLAHIRETWGNLRPPTKPKAAPARTKTVEEMGYTVA